MQWSKMCGSFRNAGFVLGGWKNRKNGCMSTLCITPEPALVDPTKLEEVLALLDERKLEVDDGTYGHLLQSCGKLRALSQGKRIHEHIVASRLEHNLFIGNHLVNMYSRCGSLEDARKAFDGMQQRNTVSWTAIIAAYVQRGICKEAIRLFHQMLGKGVVPDTVTFVTILNACADSGDLAEGRLVHRSIEKCGITSTAVENSLVNMYGKCRSLEDARRIFEGTCERDVVSWNVMIAANAQNGHEQEALQLFCEMLLEGVKPGKITFIALLNSCAARGILAEAKLIHKCVVESGLESNHILCNCLANVYGKCGRLEDAREMFERTTRRDVISWTAMIAAYAQNGHHTEVLELFQRIQLEGTKPNCFTFAAVLSSCDSQAFLADGKKIHERIRESGLQIDVVLGTALLNMYSRCGDLEDARTVFEAMQKRDVPSWNAMIGAYAQHGHPKQALQFFQRMHSEQLKPDKVTFIACLDACASLGEIAEAKFIHALVVDQSLLQRDVVLGNALINMYNKCGSCEEAKKVFDAMPRPNAVSWTTLIAAFAQNGHSEEGLHLFYRMQQLGLKPNQVTFVNAIFACSHAGLVEEGYQWFASMSRDYGITPTIEHYGCMVDMLGRVGRLAEAEECILKMPIPASLVLWMSLLGACRSQGDVERAKRAAKRVVELDPKYSAAYVVLSHMHAAGTTAMPLAENAPSGHLLQACKEQ